MPYLAIKISPVSTLFFLFPCQRRLEPRKRELKLQRGEKRKISRGEIPLALSFQSFFFLQMRNQSAKFKGNRQLYRTVVKSVTLSPPFPLLPSFLPSPAVTLPKWEEERPEPAAPPYDVDSLCVCSFLLKRAAQRELSYFAA